MAVTARRGITASLLLLSAAWSTASVADPLETTAARVPRIEIDPAAISIDVAAQRRLLDSSIRRALDAKVSASPAAEESKLAKSDALPRG